jgi:hypothetical protein
VYGLLIVLSGFSPTDTATAGSVTFDDVAPFDQWATGQPGGAGG